MAAYRVARQHAGLGVAIVERAELGGNHTWSFHEGDLTPAQTAWLEPFVTWRWPRYEVRFPGHRRVIESGYSSIASSRLRDVVLDALGAGVREGTPVAEVHPDHVRLADGGRLEAGAAVDATGFRPDAALRLGCQKFLGQELELEEPIDLAHPIVMDATVDQLDGFRFVYVLPLAPRRALVEDTYYSASPRLDAGALRQRIAAYVAGAGWRVRSVAREETGVLPIALSGGFDRFWPEDDAVARLGLRAALFHPTTGYSLPQAVAAADLLASLPPRDLPRLAGPLRRHAQAHWRGGGFFRGLNRMLLLAGRPAERYRVLERFYRLPAPLIGRFYAGRLTLGDRARLLVGSPPVPVGAAVAALLDTAVPAAPERPA